MRYTLTDTTTGRELKLTTAECRLILEVLQRASNSDRLEQVRTVTDMRMRPDCSGDSGQDSQGRTAESPGLGVAPRGREDSTFDRLLSLPMRRGERF